MNNPGGNIVPGSKQVPHMPEKRGSCALENARRRARVWFYRPQWYWHGWSTLSPVAMGHDEYARRCLMLGWTVTGRVIIPLWDCGDDDCLEHAELHAYRQATGWYDEADAALDAVTIPYEAPWATPEEVMDAMLEVRDSLRRNKP